MRAALERLREAAASDAPVILHGETGTGKELAAEALHEHSDRADRPYVVVDCGSVPRELVESELFGHAKGAFTGAVESRRGAFEAATGGTLFIDELGELPLDLQPRLLRALERKEVKPVGSNEVRKVDCRVVCATHRNLREEIAAGRFREDLFYRLAVLELELPPLRDRPEDIELYARRFLSEMAVFGPLELEPPTLARLLEHRWPGNVRELRNTIERAAALSDRVLRLPEDFGRDADLHALPPEEPPEHRGPPGSITRPLWEGRAYRDAREAVLADFEQGYLSELLERHGQNVSSAAREAGVHRNILHRLLKNNGLER